MDNTPTGTSINIIMCLCALAALLAAMLEAGCNSSGSGMPAVDVTRTGDGYYRVTIDLISVSHREAGRQYARVISQTAPDYENAADAFLKSRLDASHVSFSDALARAEMLQDNLPDVYQEELGGMAEVFAWPVDAPGDGHLSGNELLVLELLDDAATPPVADGSAAAAFGGASTGDRIIVGRNSDASGASLMPGFHTVTMFKNGAGSACGIGMLGMLFPSTVFGPAHIYATALDTRPADTPLPLDGTRSRTADVRYAVESYNTASAVEGFLRVNHYSQAFVALIAGDGRARVLEYDPRVDTPLGKPVRSASSGPLKAGYSWDVPDTIAAVNSFLLPGTFTGAEDAGDQARFASFERIFREDLQKEKIGIEEMKSVMGYTSPGGGTAAGAVSGAIYLPGGPGGGTATYQSSILDLETFELWLAAAPNGANPGVPGTPAPVYHKVFDKNPF